MNQSVAEKATQFEKVKEKVNGEKAFNEQPYKSEVVFFFNCLISLTYSFDKCS